MSGGDYKTARSERQERMRQERAKKHEEARKPNGNGNGAVSGSARVPQDWGPLLIRTRQGARDCVANAVAILENDLELCDRLRFDELHLAVFVKDMPWAAGDGWRRWADVDDIELACWAQTRGIPLRPATCAQAVALVASHSKHHAIRQYLAGLQWDGARRLHSWLSTYLGAVPGSEDEGKRYLEAVGSAWMISAVARVQRPGCKADCALVLEAPQGRGKSSALRALAGHEWFADEIADLGSKDAAQDLSGKWIIELSELSAIRRVDLTRVKAFLSRQVDHYRPSYGRLSQDFPRQCVFAGSTNASEYLADETGNRRFWPVRCERIDVGALTRDRDQLWAEAVECFKRGEPWHLQPDLDQIASAEQETRRSPDPWEAAIRAWLADRPSTEPTTADILKLALCKQTEHWTRADQTRVGQCMAALGYIPVQRRASDDWQARERRYVRKDESA